MLEINISEGLIPEPVTIMQLKGTFDAEGAEVFDSCVQEMMNSEVKDVLVDLSEVSFMNSVGIRSLHRLFYLLHPQDSEEYRRVIDEGIRQGTYKAPHLKLLNPNAEAMGLLKLISADMYLEILTGTEIEAIKSFDAMVKV